MGKMHSLIERVRKSSEYLQMEETALDDVRMLVKCCLHATSPPASRLSSVRVRVMTFKPMHKLSHRFKGHHTHMDRAQSGIMLLIKK